MSIKRKEEGKRKKPKVTWSLRCAFFFNPSHTSINVVDVAQLKREDQYRSFDRRKDVDL